MGWCADFGCTIKSSCDHRMVAGPRSCSCDACGVVCGGKYAGCKEVWAAGPRPGPSTRPAFPGRTGGRSGGRITEVIPLPDPEIRARPNEGIDEVRESVDHLRQEMRTVLTMLSQQQQILALLVESGRVEGGRDPREGRPRPTRDPDAASRAASVARAFDELLQPGQSAAPAEGATKPKSGGNPRPASPPKAPGRDDRPH